LVKAFLGDGQFLTKATTIQVRPCVSVKVEILEETLPSFKTFHTRGALVVYSLQDRSSFLAIPSLLDSYYRNCSIGRDAVVFLIGNKSDLGERTVTRKEGETLAMQHGCIFYETSAAEQDNVDISFVSLVSMVYNSSSQRQPRTPYIKAIDTDVAVYPPSTLPTPTSSPVIEKEPPPLVLEDEDMPTIVVELASDAASTVSEEPLNCNLLAPHASLWDRTVDLLDWLIPSAVSDDEYFSDEEEAFLIPPPKSTASPRGRIRFSTSRLINSLSGPLPYAPRSSSLEAGFVPTPRTSSLDPSLAKRLKTLNVSDAAKPPKTTLGRSFDSFLESSSFLSSNSSNEF
ncbi:hypothetical protein HDU91_003041, partial [Kappamyces sp. JEL0680]